MRIVPAVPIAKSYFAMQIPRALLSPSRVSSISSSPSPVPSLSLSLSLSLPSTFREHNAFGNTSNSYQNLPVDLDFDFNSRLKFGRVFRSRGYNVSVAVTTSGLERHRASNSAAPRWPNERNQITERGLFASHPRTASGNIQTAPPARGCASDFASLSLSLSLSLFLSPSRTRASLSPRTVVPSPPSQSPPSQSGGQRDTAISTSRGGNAPRIQISVLLFRAAG